MVKKHLKRLSIYSMLHAWIKSLLFSINSQTIFFRNQCQIIVLQAAVDCIGDHLCSGRWRGIAKCDSWHMAKQGLKMLHWSNWLQRQESMPVISSPPKSNDLHNDLTSPANQMLAYLAFTEGTAVTSVRALVNETVKILSCHQHK